MHGNQKDFEIVTETLVSYLERDTTQELSHTVGCPSSLKLIKFKANYIKFSYTNFSKLCGSNPAPPANKILQFLRGKIANRNNGVIPHECIYGYTYIHTLYSVN